MATRVINDSNNSNNGGNGNFKTVRINTTDLSLESGGGDDIRTVDIPTGDTKTVRVAPPDGSPLNTGDKTVLVKRPRQNAATDDKQPEPLETTPDSWCVGWLVAISGPYCGVSFPLRVGMNHIGRNEANDVCLAEDGGISRDAQIVVTYDKRGNRFYVAPGTHCSQTSEMNDAILLAPTPLESGAIIRLSDETQVRFVAFCDSQYHWEY